MVELNKIFEDYNEMGVRIYPYSSCVEAATIEIRNNYAVFANFFEFKTIAQLKLELMHEGGHCATGCTHKIDSKYDLVTKHEFKANKHAALRYMPPDSFRQAFAEGYKTSWELAEWFDIPEQFVKDVWGYYKNNDLL